MGYSDSTPQEPPIPDDYELATAPAEAEPPPPPGRRTGLWIGAAALIAAAAVAVYIVIGGRRSEEPVATAPVAVEQPQALGAAPAPVLVPPLDDSDALVRELAKAISSHPMTAAWLATDGLIRNFTVVTVNVAEGKTPSGDLRVLRPQSGFSVVERGDELIIDPRSYQRYDALAAAIAATDAAGSARLYATLKPRLEEAHAELGFSSVPFDQTLERAIVMVLETPIVADPIRVEPSGIGYAFASARLEDLAPAQKQLLRMGSRNVRAIQMSVRQIALALGIPAERLPAPTS
ncbi:MAG: DUF3014 domain-containing protein [Luteitalea sp.]|nr:DUF3014 domain-containing protein [Luteitalea sp.]